jgi:hypothetical protein
MPHASRSACHPECQSDKAESSKRTAMTAVSRGYASIALPVKDRETTAAYQLETADLRPLLSAGRSLHERVTDALGHRVFSTVTVDKLLSLAGLSSDRPAVPAADLVDWFYSYFDFTKVWSRRVIADAIAAAVAADRAGYAVGLVRAGEAIEVRDPKLVRLGESLRGDEIDLSSDAAVLDADYARHIRDGALQSAGPKPSPADAAPADTPAGSSQAAQLHHVAAAPEDSVSRLTVRASVTKAGFFDLNRALSWLRDNASTVQVDLSIAAEAGDSAFDRVQLRNGVVEPLEESGAQVHITLE